ncbi:DUF2272 domain-containing protein [Methylomagnum sp.]
MLKHSQPTTLLICLILAGCAGHTTSKPPSAARSQTQGTTPPTAPSLSPLKQTILSLAQREWDYFGRQTVFLDGEAESIPHVGMWEDDAEDYVVRVNWYWRAVNKPRFTGNDCQQPWSAAFVSWIMREAGIPDYQFPPSDSHWGYLTRLMTAADSDPDAVFQPRAISEYQPRPGDLICATRGNSDAPPLPGQSLRLVLLEHKKLHCDIVVEREGDTLASIGGNVRNSVSKTILKLDKDGFVQPTRHRPWFMVLENRL